MAEATADLEAIIARTALKYDLLPYESKPFAQSQPARLGGLAKLFGLDVTPMANARVLELGCAAGGNLIPHAARYPDATFVGVDLARTQVAAGRARIERLGLSNVEILCKSFTEIGEELGSFDYIICHGVYSWVPAQVQDAILRVIRARLSPVGVGCVSYNVMPGWRMMQPIRDAFLMAIPDSPDALARVAAAREMLGFLAEASPDQGAYGESLRSWAKRLATLPDDYIAHEFLEECNYPLLVRDFAIAAASHGLGMLGDCELSGMILDNYSPELANGVRARSGNDLIASEQWLDLLTGRTFRQTLLIANERMPGINRALTADSLAGLHLVLPIGATISRDGDNVSLTNPDGRTISTLSKEVGAAFEAMVKRQPATTSYDDLVTETKGDGRALVQDALYRMVLTGLAQVSSEPVGCAVEVSTTPRASLVVRNDASAGAAITTSLRHETVAIDPAAQAILPLLDGTADRKAIEACLIEAASSGRLSYSRDGNPVSEAKEIKATVAEHVPSLLAGLAATGLLEA